jgi:hypothetical protein
MSYEMLLEEIKELSEEEKTALINEILETNKQAAAIIEEFLNRLKKPTVDNPEPRILGLHAGSTVFVADDFDDELPDSFWLGDE